MKILSLDIEHSTKAFRPHEEGFYISCIGLKWDDGEWDQVVWVDHKDYEEPFPKEWEDVVQRHVDQADIVIAHNAKHDISILRYYGISFENVKVYCTMVGEYILSGQDTRQRTFNLGDVSTHYGMPGKLDKVKALWDMGVDTYDIHTDILRTYVLDDCQKALDIYKRQQVGIKEQGMQKVIDIQMEFIMSLSDMELYGFMFDLPHAESLVEMYEIKMAKMVEDLRSMAEYTHDVNDELEEEFNPGSGVQMSAFLFGGTIQMEAKVWTSRELKTETKYYQKMGKTEVTFPGLGFEPPTKKRNANGSVPTDKATIKKLRGNTPEQNVVLSVLSEFAQVKKQKSTLRGSNPGKGMISKIGMDGHIHPSFNQCVATTGRLTSSNPNGQNMPRGTTSPMKTCIIPEFDEIVQVDLSQVEWRAAAWLSQDPVMITEINSGIDQHNEACTKLMELPLNKVNRNYAKIFNFRMIYGGVAYGYYMDDNMPDFPLYKWEQIVKDFKAKYTVLATWWEDTYTKVMLNQGVLKLQTGRKFTFVLEDGEYSERKIKNYPVQGLAGGDILPLLAVQIRRGLVKAGLQSRMILTVHDSLVLDVKISEKDKVIQLITWCVQNLSQSVSRYYGIDWNVRLEGEIEYGSNYGKLGNTIKC